MKLAIPAAAIVAALSLHQANAVPLIRALTVQTDTATIMQVWGGCGPGWMPTRRGCVPDPRWRHRRPPRWGWRRW